MSFGVGTGPPTMSVGGEGGAIEARGVTVRFGGILALDHLSFTVPAGQRCGILGPNGAGKTTLLDVLSGMNRPSAGEVWFQGVNITREGPVQASRRGLRRTFQRHQPFGWLSVEDNVLTALEWPGRGARIVSDLLSLPSQRRRRDLSMERVQEVLEQCGLSDLRDHAAASLPIGKIRLLEFARAIADSPKLLLLDEPTSGLAARDAHRLGEVMTQINDQSGCSYILVEHDVEFVTRTCERLIVLDQGTLLADGHPDEVLTSNAVVDAYIGQDTHAGSS